MTEKRTISDKKRTLIFINIVVSCIASSMLSTALTTALPAIITDFHINVTLGQWLTSGYSLAMGWYGLSIGAAPVIAPTLAGFLVDSFGWRAIFYLVIVIVMVSLICARFVFEDVLDTVKKSFDVFSFVVSIFAFGGITLGIGNIGSYPFVSIQVLFTLFIGGIATVIFVFRQLNAPIPFLELRILCNKNYAISVIGSMLLYFVMMGSSILIPLYVQRILGYSATVSGLVVLPGSLAMAIISPLPEKYMTSWV